MSSGTFWLTLKSILRALWQADSKASNSRKNSKLLEKVRVIRLKTENHDLLPSLTVCRIRVCWAGRGMRRVNLGRRVLVRLFPCFVSSPRGRGRNHPHLQVLLLLLRRLEHWCDVVLRRTRITRSLRRRRSRVVGLDHLVA